MSEGPELLGEEALAAEHALGVLSASERAEAERRMASDPAFADQVEAWRARLAPLLDSAQPVAPPAGLWERIARGLPANQDDGLARRLRFWRSATAGSLALAAASLAAVAVLAVQPGAGSSAQEAKLLNASLMTQGGGQAQPLFVAAYDAERKALIITSLVPPGADPLHVHQLWLIPADGRPRSLGMVEPGTAKTMPMPRAMEDMVGEGAALAVSVEPPGGSPHQDRPSGPIAAMGKLAKI